MTGMTDLHRAVRQDALFPRVPKPLTGRTPVWRVVLQLRRNSLSTWGPQAFREDIITGTFLGRQSVLINAPEAIRHVFLDNHENYDRNPATNRVLEPVVGKGLFLAKGDSWKRRRRLLAPTFQPRSLELVARHAAEVTNETLADFDEQKASIVNLRAIFQDLALEVAGRSLFSHAMRQHGPNIRACLDDYGRHHAGPFPSDLVLPEAWPSPKAPARGRFKRRWNQVVEGIIEQRRSEGIGDPPRDLFDIMVHARDDDSGGGITNEEFRDEVATLIIAGHETTALTMFWAAYLLAQAPAIQERIAAEAEALDLEPDRAGANVRHLELTRAVIQEALRLYPVAFTIVRRAIAPDQVMGRKIEPQALVVLAPWVLHRHERLWQRPELFDPTRFLPGAPAIGKYSYLPFGIGPRICIGAQFAMNEATVVMAKLIRRHRIELVDSRPVTPLGIVTIVPDRIPAFRCRPRS